MTISGSTNPDNNGTFFLDASGTISTPRFSTNNNNAGLLYSTGFGYVNLALDNATISMGFAGLAIIDDIAGGDPILASDYNGINLKANTLTITTDGAVATYDYGSTTVFRRHRRFPSPPALRPSPGRSALRSSSPSAGIAVPASPNPHL